MKPRRWDLLRKSGDAAFALMLGILLGCVFALAQFADAATPGTEPRVAGAGTGDATAERPNFASRLSSTVIFLFTEDAGVPLGTAFVIGYPVPGRTGEVVPLIVTAKHVIADRTAVAGRFTGEPGAEPVWVRYDLAALRGSGDLWEHPDEGVDVAVFPTPNFPQVEYILFPVDLVASKERFLQEDVKATDRIMFPSLLTYLPGAYANYPVIRDGSIALIQRESDLLINAISTPGVSGAPVFLWPGPRLKHGSFTVGGTQPLLLGIMQGYVNTWPRVLVEVGPNATVPAFTGNSGIAVAIPSWRLLEILERDDVRRRVLELTAQEK